MKHLCREWVAHSTEVKSLGLKVGIQVGFVVIFGANLWAVAVTNSASCSCAQMMRGMLCLS